MLGFLFLTMFYVYIIYSPSSDIYYVGHSSNPIERLNQHNSNEGMKFTGKHENWVIKAVFKVSNSRAEAMQLEKFIKSQKSRSFIEKIIAEDFQPTGKLAKLVRVPHLRD